MNVSKFLVALFVFSAIVMGLSGCDWKGGGSGQGSSHYYGTGIN